MPVSRPTCSRPFSLLLVLLLIGGSATVPAADSRPDLAAAMAMRAETDTLITTRHVAEADSVSSAFLESLGSTEGETSMLVAVAYDARLAVILRSSVARQKKSTLELAERVVAMKDSLDAEPLERSISLKNLADVCFRTGDRERAVDIGHEAFDERVAAVGGRDETCARIAHNLAIYSRRHSETLHWFEIAYAVRDSVLPPDDPAVGRSAIYLGETLTNAGRFDEAELLLLRGRQIFDGENARWDNRSRHAYGLFLLKRGDLPGAKEIYDDLLHDWDPEKRQADLYLMRHTQATVLEELGESDRAIEIYEELLAIDTDPPRRAEYWTRLGQIQSTKNRYEIAIACLDSGLVLRRAADAGDDAIIATTLHNLGFAHSGAAHLDSAVVYYERGLRMRRAVFPPGSGDICLSLSSLGALHLRMGNVDDAIGLSRAAADEVAGRQDAPSLELRANGLHNLALAQATAGQADSAMAALAEVEQIRRENLRLYYGSYDEHDARRLASRLTSGIGLAMSIADHHDTRQDLTVAALDLVVRGRNVDLDQLASRERWSRLAVEPAVRAAVDTLDRQRKRLADLVVRGHDPGDPEAYSRAVAAARTAMEDAETVLARLSRKFRAEGLATRADLATVRGAVPPGVALVSYVIYVDSDLYLDSERFQAAVPMAERPRRPGMYGAVVVRGDHVFFEQLGVVKEIETDIGLWRHAVLAARDEEALAPAGLEAGSRLRERIWDPVARHVTGAQEVWMVPAAALHLLDLASLPGVDRQYVVEESPAIVRITSERDLLHTLPVSGEGALIVGGPDFESRDGFMIAQGSSNAAGHRGSTDRGTELASLHFRRLAHAAAEADTVAAIWSHAVPDESATRLTGAAATEAAFKRLAPGRRHLHLATHGFVLGPDVSEGRANPNDGDAPPLSDLFQSQPLLQSGLALAGANHRVLAADDEEDGILTAAEVVGLDLSGVEGVVLSACETGLGEITSSGNVHGLQRAFRLAGARSFVMSLWPVPDAMTAHWMAAYYEALMEGGQSSAAAAWAANRHLLARCREDGRPAPPLAWGGFVVVGSGR